MRLPSRWKQILIVLGFAVLLLFSWQAIVPPQAPAQESYTYLTSRVSRLENDNNALSARIAQLENAVSRLGGTGFDNSLPSGDATGIPNTPCSADPLFDRLATLAIELKERITTLEAQVADLQSRLPSQ